MEATRFYSAISERVKHDFLDKYEASIERVMRFPEGSRLVEGRVRRQILENFPYNVLYIYQDNTVHVLAVTHQKRKEDHWIERTKDISPPEAPSSPP